MAPRSRSVSDRRMVHSERGLWPRNPFLGEVSEGYSDTPPILLSIGRGARQGKPTRHAKGHGKK